MTRGAAIPLAAAAHANPPVGHSAVSRTWNALPSGLRASVCRECGAAADWSAELYGLDAAHDFALANCSAAIVWWSKVFDVSRHPPVRAKEEEFSND